MVLQGHLPCAKRTRRENEERIAVGLLREPRLRAYQDAETGLRFNGANVRGRLKRAMARCEMVKLYESLREVDQVIRVARAA